MVITYTIVLLLTFMVIEPRLLCSHCPFYAMEGKCLKCRSRVSFADVTDTLVFVGDEIVKRYDGDITNRNCVRCTYSERYPEYKHYD